jgi:hypothetical protein
MNKEFVPYDRALKLKQLGFDEPCLDFYDDNQELFYNHENKEKIHIGDSVKAPLFSQAFRWFREKYNLCYNINKHGYWFFEIKKDEGYGDLTDVVCCFDFESYEEAELACLDKLIEIVESKNK